MINKSGTSKLTVDVENWIIPRLNDPKKMKGFTKSSFVNDAIAEKLFRISDRSFLDRPMGSGIIKINTRIENWVNEKLKEKKNLSHRTKESFINEAIVEKLTRMDFLNDVKDMFKMFIEQVSFLITNAVNSSDFAELMKDFNDRLKNITPGFDSIELKAIETDLRFGKKELSDKIKIIYLVANDKDLPSQFADSYLVKDLISEGYLDLVDHQLSISESLLDRFDS